MASKIGYLNSRAISTTSKVKTSEDKGTNVVDDIKSMKTVDPTKKWNLSVIPQKSEDSTNSLQDIDFEFTLINNSIGTEENQTILPLTEEEIIELDTNNEVIKTMAEDNAKARLLDAEIKKEMCYSLQKENKNYIENAENALASAQQNYDNMLSYVNNTKKEAELAISKLSDMPKFQEIEDAKSLMEQRKEEYENISKDYKELNNMINETSNEYESLLYTNQANYARINNMRDMKDLMLNELEQIKINSGTDSLEYSTKMNELSNLDEELTRLSNEHAVNVSNMNTTENKLKRLIDVSNKMLIDVNKANKKYSDATYAYENIDIEKANEEYLRILSQISSYEKVLSNIDSVLEVPSQRLSDAKDNLAYYIEQQKTYDDNYAVAEQEYNAINAMVQNQAAQEEQIITEIAEIESELYDAEIELSFQKSDFSRADASAKQAEQELDAAIAQHEIDLANISKAQTDEITVDVDNANYYQSLSVSTSEAIADISAKNVEDKTIKALKATEEVKQISNSITSTQIKVDDLKSIVNSYNASNSGTSSTTDDAKVKETINTKTIDSILTKINKNLCIPNPGDTIYKSVEKYCKYYNRFKKPDVTTMLRNGFPHVFFVRPSCNILDSDYKLLPEGKGNLFFEYVYKTAPWLLRELVHKNGQDHDFMLFPSAYASSFSLSDEYITTTSYGQNYVGDKVVIGQSNKESKTAGSFEIQFRDDKRLHMYQLHKLWTEYISSVYVGDCFSPLATNIKNKVLDYAGSLYYIITAEDGESIIFWSKYYGIFPTEIPSTQYSWGSGNTIHKTDLSIKYMYSSKTDYNPKSIVEFNTNARYKENTTYVPIYDSEMNGAGRTMVGKPFITIDTDDATGIPYVPKLRFVKPSTDV